MIRIKFEEPLHWKTVELIIPFYWWLIIQDEEYNLKIKKKVINILVEGFFRINKGKRREKARSVVSYFSK